MKTLAAPNQKGGVGKSAFCVNTGHAAVGRNLRVLLVDFDPQGSLGECFPATGFHTGAEPTTSLMLFADNAEIVPERLSENLSILRADKALSRLTGQNQDGIQRPRRNLKKLAKEFDICIIDTPGVLGESPPMTIAAMVAADAVVCPTGVGLFEAKAIGDLWQWLRGIRSKGLNPRLRLMGLLPSRINPRSKEEKADLEELRKAFGKQILPLVIYERKAVKDAIKNRKPIWQGVRGSGHKTAAEEWKAVTAYILNDLGV